MSSKSLFYTFPSSTWWGSEDITSSSPLVQNSCRPSTEWTPNNIQYNTIITNEIISKPRLLCPKSLWSKRVHLSIHISWNHRRKRLQRCQQGRPSPFVPINVHSYLWWMYCVTLYSCWECTHFVEIKCVQWNSWNTKVSKQIYRER